MGLQPVGLQLVVMDEEVLIDEVFMDEEEVLGICVYTLALDCIHIFWD